MNCPIMAKDSGKKRADWGKKHYPQQKKGDDFAQEGHSGKAKEEGGKSFYRGVEKSSKARGKTTNPNDERETPLGGLPLLNREEAPLRKRTGKACEVPTRGGGPLLGEGQKKKGPLA